MVGAIALECRYERETDVLTVVLRDTELDHGEQMEDFITHYDVDGKMAEIEILDASEAVLGMIRRMVA